MLLALFHVNQLCLRNQGSSSISISFSFFLYMGFWVVGSEGQAEVRSGAVEEGRGGVQGGECSGSEI